MLMGAAIFAASLAGCGGPSLPLQVAVARGEVSGLVLVLLSEGAGPFVEAVANPVDSALVAAGFNVAHNGRDPHDASALLMVSASEEPSFIQVRVNGVLRRNYLVTATLRIADGDRVVEQRSTQFESTNGEVTSEDIAPLVATLADSVQLSDFAHLVVNRRVERAARSARMKELAEAEERRRAQEAEESEWIAARVQGCQIPSALTSCDAVQMFKVKHPESPHVAEGTRAIEEARPSMEKLQKDDNAWKTAGVEACRAQVAADACVGVELYLAKYSAGIHADEARRLLPLPPAAPPSSLP